MLENYTGKLRRIVVSPLSQKQFITDAKLLKPFFIECKFIKRHFFLFLSFRNDRYTFLFHFFADAAQTQQRQFFCILLIKNRALKMFSRFEMSWQKSQVCLFQDGRPLKAFLSSCHFLFAFRQWAGFRMPPTFVFVAKSEMKWSLECWCMKPMLINCF